MQDDSFFEVLRGVCVFGLSPRGLCLTAGIIILCELEACLVWFDSDWTGKVEVLVLVLVLFGLTWAAPSWFRVTKQGGFFLAKSFHRGDGLRDRSLGAGLRWHGL